MLFYEFDINGISYTGSRIAFGIKTRSARALFEKYPPNAEVAVRYNPSNPNQSCIEPGRIIGGIVSVVIGSGILGFLVYNLGS